MVHVLNNYGIKVTIFDPLANTEEVMHEYGLKCQNELGNANEQNQNEESPHHPITPSPHQQYDAIVLGVAHKEFLKMDLNPFKKETAVVYDVKGVLDLADMKF